MGTKRPHVDLDYPYDWRVAELQVYAQRVSDQAKANTLPVWLSFRGKDWYGVQLVIDGIPTGPTLSWPNACFVAAWLMETR